MLLPVGVDSSGDRRLPRATLSLLLLNAAIYGLCVVGGIQDPQASGILAPSPRIVEQWALLPAHPTAASFLTAPWIHLDLLHLAGNLLFLWVLGLPLKQPWERRRDRL